MNTGRPFTFKSKDALKSSMLTSNLISSYLLCILYKEILPHRLLPATNTFQKYFLSHVLSYAQDSELTLSWSSYFRRIDDKLVVLLGKYQQIELLEYLLADKISLHSTYDSKQTLAHAIAGAGQQDVAALLVDAKFNDMGREDDKDSLFFLCYMNGQAGVNRVLVEIREYLSQVDLVGRTPQMYAAMHGHCGMIRILAQHKCSVDTVDKYGNSALLLAARHGHVDTVKTLLELKANFKHSNKNGDNVLLVAAQRGHIDICSIPILRDNLLDTCNHEGYNAMHLAIKHGHAHFIEHLLTTDIDTSAITGDHNSMQGLSILSVEKGAAKIFNLPLKDRIKWNVKNRDGGTPLHVAVENDCLEAVIILMNHKVDMYVYNKDGYTPFHLALHQNKMNIVRTMVDNGVDVNFSDATGTSTLLFGAKNGNNAVIEYLLDKKADIECTNADGDTSLLLAVIYGHANTLKLLLDNKAKIDHVNKNGQSALFVATIHNNIDMITQLVQSGADTDIPDTTGLSPLLYAVHKNSETVSTSLIDLGANINYTDHDGVSIIMHAIKKQHFALISKLISKKADLMHICNAGYSVFMYACKYCDSDIVNTLFQHLPDICYQKKRKTASIFRDMISENNSTTMKRNRLVEYIHHNSLDGHSALTLVCSRGLAPSLQQIRSLYSGVDAFAVPLQNPLLLAAQAGHNEIVEFCLHSRANVDISDKMGKNALMFAAENGHRDTVGILMHAKANIYTVDKDGMNAFLHAVTGKDENAVQLLVELKADVKQVNKNKQDALLLATGNAANLSLVQKLVDMRASTSFEGANGVIYLNNAARNAQLDVYKLLIEMNAGSESNSIRLIRAVDSAPIEVIQLLLEGKAAITAQYPDSGSTTLMCAVSAGRVKTVQLLLDNDANVHSINAKGQTALMIAAELGYYDIVSSLVSKGAKMTTECKSKKNALVYAVQSGHSEIAVFLAYHMAFTGCDTDALKMLRNDLKRKRGSIKSLHNLYSELKGIKAQDLIGKHEYKQPLQECDSRGRTLPKPKAKTSCECMEALNTLLTSTHDSKTLLCLAVENGHNKMVTVLQEHMQDINMPNCLDVTAIHHAAKNGKEDMVQHLQSLKADINYTYDSTTALELCTHDDDIDTMKQLIQYKAHVNIINDEDRSLLHESVQQQRQNITKMLVESNAIVDIPDKRGETPLWYAVENDNYELMEYLISCKADIQSINKSEESLQSYAVSKNKPEAIKLLTKSNADINYVNGDGSTVMHKAVEHGSESIVRLLLACEVNIDSANKTGLTPLTLAVETGKKALIKIFCEHKSNAKYAKHIIEAIHLYESQNTTDVHYVTLLRDL